MCLSIRHYVRLGCWDSKVSECNNWHYCFWSMLACRDKSAMFFENLNDLFSLAWTMLSMLTKILFYLFFICTNYLVLITIMPHVFISQNSLQQIRMAIENISNLETTSKKWLSKMAKDCSCFCKIWLVTCPDKIWNKMIYIWRCVSYRKEFIMNQYIILWLQKLTVSNDAAPPSIRKQPKKITFAKWSWWIIFPCWSTSCFLFIVPRYKN